MYICLPTTRECTYLRVYICLPTTRVVYTSGCVYASLLPGWCTYLRVYLRVYLSRCIPQGVPQCVLSPGLYLRVYQGGSIPQVYTSGCTRVYQGGYSSGLYLSVYLGGYPPGLYLRVYYGGIPPGLYPRVYYGGDPYLVIPVSLLAESSCSHGYSRFTVGERLPFCA